jgi:hypothetical protein
MGVGVARGAGIGLGVGVASGGAESSVSCRDGILLLTTIPETTIVAISQVTSAHESIVRVFMNL